MHNPLRVSKSSLAFYLAFYTEGWTTDCNAQMAILSQLDGIFAELAALREIQGIYELNLRLSCGTYEEMHLFS